MAAGSVFKMLLLIFPRKREIEFASRVASLGFGAGRRPILNHPVKSGVKRAPPDGVAVLLLGRDIEVMLMEPKERLPRVSKFLDLVTSEIAPCTRRSGSFS
jgi:hypothetical protein